MKLLFLFIISSTLLFSNQYSKLINYYKGKEYKKACKIGISLFRRGERENTLISLIGDSCAKADFINILGEIQKYQTETKASRENASYFATLILQKRLIFQFLFDNLDISNLKLPKTDHILSRVFINLANKNYIIISNNPKRVKIVDGKRVYLLYCSYYDKKIYIEEFSYGLLIKKHRFS